MKRIVRYTVATAFALIVAVYVSTALGVSSARRHGTGCTGLNIVVKDSLQNGFVTCGDIKSYITKEMKGFTDSEEIDLVKIEEILDGKSAVLKSEAYMTRDGVLNIEVTQRTPVVKFKTGEGGFYADKEGYLFPLQRHNPEGIMVVDGSVPLKADSGYKGEAGSPEEKRWLEGVLDMIGYINGHDCLPENISRLNVLGNGDLVICHDGGKERFIFGKPDNIEMKFKRIRYYYSKIVPEKGENTYSTVNVKYDGQVICRK